MKPLIFIGNGGHARALRETAKRLKLKIQGFIGPDKGALGDEAWAFETLNPMKVLLVNAIGSTESVEKRTQIFRSFHEKGFRFATLIHPTAVVSDDAEIAEGAQILAGCIAQPGAKIGKNVILNTGVQIDHDCVIGDYTHLAPGVILSGGVTIGNECHIGTGAIVIQGIKIGEKSLIAAGAVVTKDAKAGSRLAGVPATPMQSNQ